MTTSNGMLNFDKSQFKDLMEREKRIEESISIIHTYNKQDTKERNLLIGLPLLFTAGFMAGIVVMILAN